MKTIRNPAAVDFSSAVCTPSGDAVRQPSTTHYTLDMLQRTTPPSWPDPVDYIALERVAHQMRNQYIAGLLSRVKRALARRLAQRMRRQSRRVASSGHSSGATT
jgi:hypothetical protein